MSRYGGIRVNIRRDGRGNPIRMTQQARRRLIEETTAAVEARAKLDLQHLVYDQPPAPTYVRTGHLMASVGHDMQADGDGAVFASADYAEYVHEGANGQPPKPFLMNALREELSRVPARARRIARQMGLIQ